MHMDGESEVVCTKQKKLNKAKGSGTVRPPLGPTVPGKERLFMCLFGIQRVNGTVESVLCKHFYWFMSCFLFCK